MPFKFDSKDLAKDLEKGLNNFKITTDTELRWFALTAFNQVLDHTPVDRGFLRASWNIARARMNTRTRKRFKVQSLDPDPQIRPIFITNAMPYAHIVEYGLYPQGGGPYWRKLGGKRVFGKWSKGGFSTSAPNGMLRLGIAEALVALKKKR